MEAIAQQRWPLNRDLLSHSFVQLFWGIDYWPLNIGDGRLISGHLMEVQLYTEWDDNDVCTSNLPVRREKLSLIETHEQCVRGGRYTTV